MKNYNSKLKIYDKSAKRHNNFYFCILNFKFKQKRLWQEV